MNLWQRLSARYMTLAVRERLILLGALCGGLFFLCDLLLFRPQATHLQALNDRESSVRQAVQSVEAELTLLESLAAREPETGLQQSLTRLQAQLQQLDGQLESAAGGLVSGAQLPGLLQTVLEQTGSVQLVAMLTLPPEAVSLQGDAPTATQSASVPQVHLYRHGVVMTLQGDYAGIAAYLRRLENNPWRFYWDSVEYRVQRHPQAQAVLRVYTLATDRGILDAR